MVLAGRINKLFGTEGGVALTLYPAFAADFTTGTPLMVTIDGLEVPLWCERFERRGQSGATATFVVFVIGLRSLCEVKLQPQQLLRPPLR